MNRNTVPCALLASTVVVGMAGAAVLAEPLRLMVMVAFCLLLPGSGWARRAGRGDVLDTFALAVLISTSATILVSTAMVVTNTWSVTGGVAALAAITVLGYVPRIRGAGPTGAVS